MGKKQSISGVVFLIASGLAGYFLLLRGGIALFAGMAGRAISNLSSPDEVKTDGLEGLMVLGAVMASAGVCLTPGLLVLALRRLSGKPYPRRRTAIVYTAISLALVGSSWAITSKLTTRAPSPASRAGLEGLWHASGSTKLKYRFNPDGTLDAWSEGMGGGHFGTWSRTGQTVTIKTIRDWGMTGTLTKSKIAGTLSTTSTGKAVAPETWVRDVVP